MAVQPIPDGYHTITPQLAVEGAARAIDFYKQAFGAEELTRAPDPSGQKIWHAALRIGTSIFFVNDVFPEMGGSVSHTTLWIYAFDVDALFARAVAAGATVAMPPADMFWGDRLAQVGDGFGQKWTLATHVKDLTPDEMKKVEAEFVAAMKR